MRLFNREKELDLTGIGREEQKEKEKKKKEEEKITARLEASFKKEAEQKKKKEKEEEKITARLGAELKKERAQKERKQEKFEKTLTPEVIEAMVTAMKEGEAQILKNARKEAKEAYGATLPETAPAETVSEKQEETGKSFEELKEEMIEQYGFDKVQQTMEAIQELGGRLKSGEISFEEYQKERDEAVGSILNEDPEEERSEQVSSEGQD